MARVLSSVPLAKSKDLADFPNTPKPLNEELSALFAMSRCYAFGFSFVRSIFLVEGF